MGPIIAKMKISVRYIDYAIKAVRNPLAVSIG